MELSCSIIPQVRNKNGEIVDSKLFLDIMNLSSKREVIVDLYQRITSSFFLTENSDRLEFDENNDDNGLDIQFFVEPLQGLVHLVDG